MDRFPVTRIITLADGRSAFQDDAIELKDAGEIGLMTPTIATSGISLRANDPGYDFDWHPAPARQFILMLTGQVRIEVATGEARTFGPGEVVYVEDTTGTGHKSRNAGNSVRLSAFVRVEGEPPFVGV